MDLGGREASAKAFRSASMVCISAMMACPSGVCRVPMLATSSSLTREGIGDRPGTSEVILIRLSAGSCALLFMSRSRSSI